MNIRIIVSDEPGIVLAQDHRSLAEVKAMDPADRAAWLAQVIDAADARGPASVKKARPT